MTCKPGFIKPGFYLLVILLLPLFSLSQILVNYPAPTGSPLNDDFKVRVRSQGKNWQDIAVYLVKVDQVIGTRHTPQNSSIAYFDFSGTVEIAVTYNKGKIRSSRIRPLAYGINSIVNGNTIHFSLSQPRNISIEINGDIFHNLQILANPPEANRPDKRDTNVIYYGPGIHYIGRGQVHSGKTVYISGGAIVQGQLLVSHAQNVRILGRGILYQSPVRLANPDSATQSPSPFISPQARGRRGRADIITVEYSKDVEINGLVIVPTSYTVLVGESKQVQIRNIKSFSAGGNNDGLDVFCSSDVTIANVFMRNSDDCIAIYGHRWGYYGNLKNITVMNSVLWADVAHPILVGTHGDSANPDTLENLTFTDINILDHNEAQINYQGCMSLNAGDDNMIRNVRFENFNIEDIRQGQLVNIRVMFNRKYNTSAGRSIENIYFKNITYNGTRANLSIISGYDDSLRSIRNVTFENLRINGRLISDTMREKPAWFQTADMARFFVGEHVTGLKFIAPVDAGVLNNQSANSGYKRKEDEN